MDWFRIVGFILRLKPQVFSLYLYKHVYGFTIAQIVDENGFERYLSDFSLVVIAARVGIGTEL